MSDSSHFSGYHIQIGGEDLIDRYLHGILADDPAENEDNKEKAEKKLLEILKEMRVRFGTLLKTDNVSFLIGAGASLDEVGVSVSGAYSKLTSKTFSRDLLKQRTKMAGQRRTVGYFIERKFNVPEVKKTLRQYGSGEDYGKVIVSWGWTEDAEKQAEEAGIILWDFRDIIREIGERFRSTRAYFADDTLRTLQLFVKAMEGG